MRKQAARANTKGRATQIGGKGRFLGVALASILACPPCAFARTAVLPLKPGKYALTITYEVQDQRQNESRTITRCIEPRDLNDPERVFNDQTAETEKKEPKCLVTNLREAKGRISYDADCRNRRVRVQGNLTDTGFSVVRTVSPRASESVPLKFTVRGTRTGKCAPRQRL